MVKCVCVVSYEGRAEGGRAIRKNEGSRIVTQPSEKDIFLKEKKVKKEGRGSSRGSTDKRRKYGSVRAKLCAHFDGFS